MLEEIQHDQKPRLLEIDTYRFKGHSMSDPGKYRTRNDLDQARQSRDPLDRLSAYLIDECGASREELADIEKRANENVLEAVHLAEQAPEPDQSELWKDIML